jgi:lipoate-protein ligase A
MDTKIKDLTVEEFRSLLSDTLKEAMDDWKEDMLALSSQQYIDSIKESRKEYKEGKFKNLEDILNV